MIQNALKFIQIIRERPLKLKNNKSGNIRFCRNAELVIGFYQYLGIIDAKNMPKDIF